MAVSTVNFQKMKSVSAELDKIYTSMISNKRKLDETVASLAKAWQGEGAAAYQSAYRQSAEDLALLAEAIQSCSAILMTSANTYSKADAAAADAIKSKMAKG